MTQSMINPKQPSTLTFLFLAVLAVVNPPVWAGENHATLAPPATETLFSTFSLCAIDPASGECGVAVTTRVPYVGRAVPWVRAGVGAVATQSWTRVEYGREGLDLMEQGLAPTEAMTKMMAPDKGKQRRQVGMINMKGETAAFTGDQCGAWAGSRQGTNYTVQANIMVGPEVIDAVADHFEATAGSGMPLAERMILAMEAGQKTGGDKRWGLPQSAAIKIADPKVSGRGNDHISLDLRVDEHAQPLQEMKRIYYKTARRLGYRSFSQIEGGDVVELKRMLHALGYWRPSLTRFPDPPAWTIVPTLRDEQPEVYRQKVDAYRKASSAYLTEFGRFDEETIAAVDRFRKDKDLVYTGNPSGLVGPNHGHRAKSRLPGPHQEKRKIASTHHPLAMRPTVMSSIRRAREHLSVQRARGCPHLPAVCLFGSSRQLNSVGLRTPQSRLRTGSEFGQRSVRDRQYVSRGSTGGTAAHIAKWCRCSCPQPVSPDS